MKTEKLNFCLPAELVAQHPSDVRSNARLLVLNRTDGSLTDSRFGQIGDFLRQGDCLVLNDTKVLPARFFAQRTSGGKIEGLFLAESGDGIWEVMLKGAARLKTGEEVYLKDREKKDFCRTRLLEKTNGGECRLELDSHTPAAVVLDRIGFPPLPPYIKRSDDPMEAAADTLRYQTVYARKAGSVAAPTAGLHFTNELIGQLKGKGINFAYITLHIGLGTFKPITAENLEEHKIHREQFSIDEKNTRIINSAKRKAGRIIAVGTTSVRTLETAAVGTNLKPISSSTELFITPGYKFKIVDAMVTNFHLPKSTLLALVASFAGIETILTAYKYAVEQKYRFYSYGDAMLIV